MTFEKHNFLLYSLFICSIIFFIQCNSSRSIIKDRPHEAHEKKLITQTIEKYFEGWMTGDTTLLGTAMHSTCQLKNIKDDGVIIYDRATYLGFFKPRPRRENAGGRIVDIDVSDDIGSAKCEIHTAERLYTDYFNLMKVRNQWYIVDKIATNKLRVEND